MRKALGAVLAVFFILTVVSCGNRPYMTINGQEISVKEFNKVMKKNMPPKDQQYPGVEEQVKAFTENQLVQETVLAQLKNEYQIELSEDEINQIYNFYVLAHRRYPTLEIAEELFPYYENSGMGKEEVMEMMANTLLQAKLVEVIYADRYQKATADQVQAWYDEKKEQQFVIPKSYYVSQLYVEKPAEEVTEEIEESTETTGEDVVEVTEEVVEVTEEVVEETAAEKLLKELEEIQPQMTTEKSFMKKAAKYMEDNPYFNKKDYKANRGFIYINEGTKEIDDLLKDIQAPGVSAVYDYAAYNAYIIFYLYDMIPEHTVELDQIRSYAEMDAAYGINQALYQEFYQDKINGSDIVYNEAERLKAKEEIVLEEEEIILPGEDTPVVEDGIDDSVMEEATEEAETTEVVEEVTEEVVTE